MLTYIYIRVEIEGVVAMPLKSALLSTLDIKYD